MPGWRRPALTSSVTWASADHAAECHRPQPAHIATHVDPAIRTLRTSRNQSKNSSSSSSSTRETDLSLFLSSRSVIKAASHPGNWYQWSRDMSNRPVAATLWVGNLPFETTEAELHTHLSQIGPIKNLRLISDRETGKPKGFGFCEFYDKATAESAYRNLNNTDFKGRPLRIDYAEEEFMERAGKPPRSARPDGPPGGAGGPGGPRSPLLPPIGYKAASGSAAQVAALLGGPPANDMRIQDQLNELLASKSRPELWEVLRHLKEFLQADRATAQAYLAERPGLSKAVFQAQVLLGMVKPLGGFPPGPGVFPPQQAAMAGPPPAIHSAGGPLGLQVAPGTVLQAPGPMAQVVVLDASGQQQTVMVPAGQLSALGMQAAPTLIQPGPVPMGQQQPLQQVQLQPPPLQQVQLQPQPLAQVPQQQGVVVQAPPPPQAQAPPPAAGGMFAGQDPQQMQALLRQVQTLSDEQINGLPDNFKQQVLYVKEQIRLGNVRIE